MQSCHIVECKTIVIIEGGDEAEDDNIVSNPYTAVRITFLALKNQGMVRVSYIGSDPLLLPLSLTYIDKLSKRADMGTSKNHLAISVCGLAAAIVALFAFLRSTYGNEKDGNHDGATDNGEKSIVFPSTIGIILSASSNDVDELGSNVLSLSHHCIPTDHAKDIIIILSDEEKSNWCRFVFLQSIALSSSSPQ